MVGNNYVCIKHTIWQRYYFKDDADMDKIAEIVENQGDFVLDELGFTEAEDLCETLNSVNPGDIILGSTAEVFKDAKEIWNNNPEK